MASLMLTLIDEYGYDETMKEALWMLREHYIQKGGCFPNERFLFQPLKFGRLVNCVKGYDELMKDYWKFINSNPDCIIRKSYTEYDDEIHELKEKIKTLEDRNKKLEEKVNELEDDEEILLVPLCKDCEIETKKHCDVCGGYGSE